MSWLVIANQVKADIYHLNGDGHLRLIEELSNPLGRERNKALGYSKPGIARSKFKGSAPHALAPEKTPHEEIKEQFAKKISAYLRKQYLKKNFNEIQVVAEPKMLGKIRHYSEKFLKGEVVWTSKDLEKVPQVRWPKVLGYKRKPEGEFYKKPAI